ncbi:protein kinase superfamily protein [Actinidia rufa]|uniref:Protein kinase superfamily protein n=1 Tax=Actinidia rufa TaxID=165716 RepID=A0A7J0E5S2_9ERIC|nr:protein kinase superfamily protein [Actinidia rufa]
MGLVRTETMDLDPPKSEVQNKGQEQEGVCNVTTSKDKPSENKTKPQTKQNHKDGNLPHHLLPPPGPSGQGLEQTKMTSASQEGAENMARQSNSHQPEHCGYHPGFDLSCAGGKHPVLELPFSVKVSVNEIDYESQTIRDKIGKGSFGTVYKGKLSNDVHVSVKILNNVKGNGDEFTNEVGTMGRIDHINVKKFISSDQERLSLGWEKLQDIAIGIAKGIEYLHLGCDQQNLHFDIKPHNIFVRPQVYTKDFRFWSSKLCSEEQSAVLMTAARGTVGYIAPEVFSRNFGEVSYKWDVYSFRMLLLGNQIEKDGDKKIVRKLTIVGLWCVQWYPVDRPSMKVVVQILEGDGDTFTVPPSPCVSTTATIFPITSQLQFLRSFLPIYGKSSPLNRRLYLIIHFPTNYLHLHPNTLEKMFGK